MNKDEIVDGVLYPKGAVLFMNTCTLIWLCMVLILLLSLIAGFMFHDERYFDRPFEFLPERFLLHPLGVKPDVADDPARRADLLFGGGRRVCPGTLMARSNLVCRYMSFYNVCDPDMLCQGYHRCLHHLGLPNLTCLGQEDRQACYT